MQSTAIRVLSPQVVVVVTYCSDVHLEYQKNSKIPKHLVPTPVMLDANQKNILILAGDIGHVTRVSYIIYLKQCRLVYDHVLVVSGNHEYWAQAKHGGRDKRISMETIDEKLRLVCEEADCIFLQKRAIKIEGYWFLGCTMWTDVPENLQTHVSAMMNDYQRIFYTDPKIKGLKKITSEHIDSIHQDHKHWLATKLNWIDNLGNKEKAIVVTHHLPSTRILNSRAFPMSEEYVKYAYGSTHLMDELASRSRLDLVHAWICGHHHDHSHRSYLIPYSINNKETTENTKEEVDAIETKGTLSVYLNCIGYPTQSTLSSNLRHSTSFIAL